MKIAKKHSHLNGEEWLLVHQKNLYQEIIDVIQSIDAEACRTKKSREKNRRGDLLYSPEDLNRSFEQYFTEKGWLSTRYSYYLAHNLDQLEIMSTMSIEEQRQYLEGLGEQVLYSYNQIDHVKNRIAVEVQFGKYYFVAYDIFVKHLAFYAGRETDVGVEILPTKVMQQDMSSGIAYYEKELHNILRHGRASPAVPLVIIGLEPD
jgi:hypothetical protein